MCKQPSLSPMQEETSTQDGAPVVVEMTKSNVKVESLEMAVIDLENPSTEVSARPARVPTELAEQLGTEEAAGWGETLLVGLLGLGMAWFTMWCLFKGDALPGGWLFSLGIVYLGGTFGGLLTEKIRVPTGEGKSVPLPGLVGMLVMGFVIRNVCDMSAPGSFTMDKKISSSLRGLALAVILIRAGLGLSLEDLKRLWGTMAMMSTVPATVEAMSGMCFAAWFFGFDVKWGLMLGYILADVSPAVTVPLLLKFQEEGQGSDKGIPSILLAASSLNSVFAICCFGIVMGFNFTGSGTPMWETILRGVLDVVGGVAVGVFSGWLVYKLTAKHSNAVKFALTFAFACVQIFGLKVEPLKSSGGNALATLVMGLTIANLWDKSQFEGMQASFNMVWKSIGERMMFSLLGASMALDDLEGSVVGAGLAIIFLGLFFRGIAAMFSISMTDWDAKEKLFTAITWCPKATVQAALSTVALEYVMEHAAEFGGEGSESYATAVDWATKLKTIAILSIITTAPLFAALMDWGGYNLLKPSAEPKPPAPDGTLVLQSKEEVVLDEIDEEARSRVQSEVEVVDTAVTQQQRARHFSVPVGGETGVVPLPVGTRVVQRGPRTFSKQFQ